MFRDADHESVRMMAAMALIAAPRLACGRLGDAKLLLAVLLLAAVLLFGFVAAITPMDGLELRPQG